MRRSRIADQALRLAAEPSRQPYVCRSCIAQASRQFHTFNRHEADNSFLKLFQEGLFGKKKTAKQEERESKREAKREGEEPAAVVRDERAGAIVARDGTEYQMAAKVNPAVDKQYIPSSTWDGLERVGGPQWVKRRLDQGEQYTGFLTDKSIQLDNGQWRHLLHVIAVEALTLQAAGRDALEICNARTSATGAGLANQAQLATDANGQVEVRYSSQNDPNLILDDIASSAAVDVATQVGFENTPLSQPSNSFQEIKFNDPALRFAIVKRVTQLTGKRVPDFAVSRATTLKDLYNSYKLREKPKRLAQDPRIQKLAETLPNVMMHSKRRTMVHKEKAIGRWKVIENELALRNIPLFSTTWKSAKEGVHLAKK